MSALIESKIDIEKLQYVMDCNPKHCYECSLVRSCAKMSEPVYETMKLFRNIINHCKKMHSEFEENEACKKCKIKKQCDVITEFVPFYLHKASVKTFVDLSRFMNREDLVRSVSPCLHDSNFNKYVKD